MKSFEKMKLFKALGLLAMLVIATPGFAQQTRSADTLLKSYQKIIKAQNETIQKQDEKIQRLEAHVATITSNLLSQDGNFISHDGNVLTWAGLALTIFTIAIGFGGWITISNANRKLKNAERKMKANDALATGKMTDLDSRIKDAEERSKTVQTLEANFQKDYDEFTIKTTSVSEDITKMRNEFTTKSMVQLQILPIYNAAMDKMHSGSIRSAIAKFNKVIQIDPDNVNAKACIAICHSGNDDEQALIDIGEVIHGRDVTEEAWVFYGIILRRVHKYDLAVKAFQKALDFDKKSFSNHNHLGYTYMYMGDLQNSFDAFEESLSWKKNNSAATYGKLKLCFLDEKFCGVEGKKELIATAIKNALNDKEESPELPYYNFGYAFALMASNEETSKCLEELDVALETCNNLGILKEQLTDYKLFEDHHIELLHLQECIKKLDEKIAVHSLHRN